MCFDDSLSFLPFVNDSFPGKFMLHWHALQGSQQAAWLQTLATLQSKCKCPI